MAWTGNNIISRNNTKDDLRNTLFDTGKKIKDSTMKGSLDENGNSLNDSPIFQNKETGDRYVFVPNTKGGTTMVQINPDATKSLDFRTVFNDNVVQQKTIREDGNYNSKVFFDTAVLDKKGIDKYLVGAAPATKSFSWSANNYTKDTKQTNSGGGGGGYTPTYSAPDLSGLYNQIATLQSELQELKNPKLYSAKELAEHYNIADTLANEDYYRQLYTDYVNENWGNQLDEYDEQRLKALINGARYNQMLQDQYIKSYVNEQRQGNATNNQAIAANALKTQILNNYDASQNDYQMLQDRKQLEQDWQAQLADVDRQAKDAYTMANAYLMQAGNKHYTSEIQDTINGINAAATRYKGDLDSYRQKVQGYSNQYAGLANAASTRANTAASNNSSYIKQLENYYNQLYGGDYNRTANTIAGLYRYNTQSGKVS